MKIAVDIDNVLLDIMNPLIDYHNREYNTKHTRDMFQKHNLEVVWGGTKKDTFDEIDRFYETEEFKNIKPVYGAVPAIKKITEKHQLHAVTSRTVTTAQITRYQLEKYFPRCINDISYANSFSNNHTSIEKLFYFNKVGANLIIEDCVDHVKNLPSGMKAIILDYPWNQVELPENVERAMDWKHVLEIIEKI